MFLISYLRQCRLKQQCWSLKTGLKLVYNLSCFFFEKLRFCRFYAAFTLFTIFDAAEMSQQKMQEVSCFVIQLSLSLSLKGCPIMQSTVKIRQKSLFRKQNKQNKAITTFLRVKKTDIRILNAKKESNKWSILRFVLYYQTCIFY